VPTEGKIVFEGRDITGLPQHRYVHAGISKSFQITNIFPQLSTHENVRIAAQATVAGKKFLVETLETRLRPARRPIGLLEEVGLGGAGSSQCGGARTMDSSGRWRLQWHWRARHASFSMDEPTAGMSPEETKNMVRLIERLSKAEDRRSGRAQDEDGARHQPARDRAASRRTALRTERRTTSATILK